MTGIDPVAWAAAIAGGYLLGSIPFGLLLTRAAGLGDIRAIGSGNIGATNVLRTGNKALAAATLLLDGGKGALAAYLSSHWAGNDAGYASAFAAVLGHVFPIWLRFKGGKGVATTLGALIGSSWIVGVLACGIWLAIAAIFRFSSLAALAALASAPFLAYDLAGWHLAYLAGALALLGWWRHKSNILRLIAGNEPRIRMRTPNPR